MICLLYQPSLSFVVFPQPAEPAAVIILFAAAEEIYASSPNRQPFSAPVIRTRVNSPGTASAAVK